MRLAYLLALLIVMGLCMTSCREDEPDVTPPGAENSQKPGDGGQSPVIHQHSIKASIDYSHTSMGRRKNENAWMVDVILTLDNMSTGRYYTSQFSTTLYFEESASVYYCAPWEGYATIYGEIGKSKWFVDLWAYYQGFTNTVTHKIHLELYTELGEETLTLIFEEPIWTDMKYDNYGNETEVKYYGDDVQVKLDMSRVHIYDDLWH